MGIFRSKAAGASPARVSRDAGASAGALSIIGTGTSVRGDIETAGVIKVEGSVAGDVEAGQQVLVARGGVVRGDIKTKEAVIGGTVTGAIHAAERVEIQSGGAVHGDITTRRIAVAEGGILNGQIRMGDAPAVAAQKAGGGGKGEPRSPVPPAVPRSSEPAGHVGSPSRASSPNPGH